VTAPLTPPECDLQDFPFMPLHVARLRDSDLAAEVEPESCWYAVLLWAAAWHQIPAGSLPNNDAVLARLLGLGRDLRTFRKHKDAALRGFVLCDDGRLYHPVVAEQALNAWEGKLQQRWRSECARIKKSNQRNDLNVPLPTYEQFLSRRLPNPSPQVVPGDTSKSPPGQTLQEKGIEKGTGTGTGKGRTKEVVEAAQALPTLIPLDPPVRRDAAPTRGSRLKDDWSPSGENLAFAIGLGFSQSEVDRMTSRFRNYWLAKAGKDAAKLDWSRTWQNWASTEAERRPRAANGTTGRVDWV